MDKLIRTLQGITRLSPPLSISLSDRDVSMISDAMRRVDLSKCFGVNGDVDVRRKKRVTYLHVHEEPEAFSIGLFLCSLLEIELESLQHVCQDLLDL